MQGNPAPWALMTKLTDALDALHLLACHLSILGQKQMNREAQVSFQAPDGASTAMQLFTGQATRLSSALQDGTLCSAQLCSFFTLLGAMPQCLKAEADAVLAMVKSARETNQEQGEEAHVELDGGSCLGALGSAVLISANLPSHPRLHDGTSSLASLKHRLHVVIQDAT